jgi:hypothetical protein
MSPSGFSKSSISEINKHLKMKVIVCTRIYCQKQGPNMLLSESFIALLSTNIDT